MSTIYVYLCMCTYVQSGVIWFGKIVAVCESTFVFSNDVAKADDNAYVEAARLDLPAIT